jgi:GNAT superfamily N-acetyltransferase
MATREVCNLPSTPVEQLENAHRWSMLEYTRAVARHCPEVGATALEVAGGLAVYNGASAFSVTVGAGLRHPVSTAELDRLEDFFGSRSVPVAVEVCPHTHPSLMQQLESRRYGVREITHVLYLEFDDRQPDDLLYANDAQVRPGGEEAARTGIEVGWIGDAETAFVVDLMAKLFYVSDPGSEVRAKIQAFLRAPNSLNMIASIDGRWAGAAGGLLPSPGRIAVLSCSATLPEFRRCGVHSALLKFRLRHARQHGCCGALVAAIPGSDSERNLERHGFKVIYQKRTYMKPLN